MAAIADVGYYDGQHVKACLDAGITPYVTKPPTSRNQKAGLVTKADVAYDAVPDTYRCPAGATLTYRFTADEAGRLTRYYATPAVAPARFAHAALAAPKRGVASPAGNMKDCWMPWPSESVRIPRS